jgi:drug/metabolite transporter (DMT)-like permease
MEKKTVTARRIRANLLLLLTALIWGAAFVSQRVSMDYIGPFTFLCSRSLLGGVVLLPLIAVFSGKIRGEAPVPGAGRQLILGGVLCGAALFVASALQQIGIQYTSVGKAGFLTAMYIVLIPLSGIFLRRRIGFRVFSAVAVAMAGMYFLCLHGNGLERINRGDLLELFCALCFTVHILVVDRFAGRVDGVKMSCIQFFVCGALSFVCMLVFETPSWSDILAAWLPIAYAGVMSSGVGYTLQIIAQKDTDPTVASLLMSLEAVFSLIAGWLILGQRLSGWELLGCGLMFAAIVWVQLPQKKKEE